MNIALILSSGQLTSDLRSEFGKIPPSFLPVGNERLYRSQIKLLKNYVDQIFISLPDTYTLSDFDKRQITNQNVQILRVSDNRTINEAIVEAIGAIKISISRLIILYGDTLIRDINLEQTDFVSVHHTSSEFDWAPIADIFSQDETGGSLKISGCFSFTNITTLVQVLKQEKILTKSLNAYEKFYKLQPNKSGTWYDFGHLQTYYRSAQSVTTERKFNSLTVTKNIITKTSKDYKKILAEAKWYNTLPKELKVFTPNLLEVYDQENCAHYSLERLNLPTLSSLAVFGELSQATWEDIFHSCNMFLSTCASFKIDSSDKFRINNYFFDKTYSRLSKLKMTASGRQILNIQKINSEVVPNIDDLILTTQNFMNALNNNTQCIIHGDFCFSNILYDYRGGSIKIIDPRGLLPDGTPSIYGPQIYELAKLAHSVFGLYDFIVAGSYKLNRIGSEVDISYDKVNNHKVIKAFLNSDLINFYSYKTLVAMTIHLLLSMLPLHSDDAYRQTAFLCMAHKLSKELQ